MAASATVKLTLSTTENVGGFTWPAEKSFTNAAPPLLADRVDLIANLVALSIPAGTEWIIVIPPATNALPIQIAGANVAGATLHPTRPLYFPVPSAGASFWIGGNIVANVQIYYV